MLTRLIPGRRFEYPKSLYAVEDTLRFVVGNKPHALVLDFFAGSGTTAHAVMRLNKQDGGRRRSIMVTNNEVSAAEADALTSRSARRAERRSLAEGRRSIAGILPEPRMSEAAREGRSGALLRSYRSRTEPPRRSRDPECPTERG